MSTNVLSENIIKGVWDPVKIESRLYTATAQYEQPYMILWLSYPRKLSEEKEEKEEENLYKLFSEFAEEDMKMAEAGLSEYKEILKSADREC